MATEPVPLVALLYHYLLRANGAPERELRPSAGVAHELRASVAAAMISVETALITGPRPNGRSRCPKPWLAYAYSKITLRNR